MKNVVGGRGKAAGVGESKVGVGESSKERRDIVREKRDRDKQVRQLSIDRADLVRQKELTVTQSARLAHEKNLLVGNNKRMKRNIFSTKIALVLEKKVNFFACLFQHVIR